jgi:hypothetical protein
MSDVEPTAAATTLRAANTIAPGPSSPYCIALDGTRVY